MSDEATESYQHDTGVRDDNGNPVIRTYSRATPSGFAAMVTRYEENGLVPVVESFPTNPLYFAITWARKENCVKGDVRRIRGVLTQTYRLI